jgi:hypothetical protein
VEIRGSAGKLRFGTTLTEEEKDWLVADLRRVLWPAGQAAPTPAAEGGLRLAMPAAAGPRARGGSEPFSIDLPPPKGGGALAGILVGAVVVGAFLALGIFLMKDAGFFRWLWLAMNSLFALALGGSLFRVLRSLGVVVRISGTREEILVQRRKGYRVLKEERIARAGIEVRCYESGRSNQTAMVAVEFVGADRVLRLARWYPAEQAEPVVRQLRELL